jgi:hypothetical protein
MVGYTTPILIICWRRPHMLRQVIDAIRPFAPTNIYVACDGFNPDQPDIKEKVASTRAAVETEIDWPCVTHKRYADSNLGCSVGPTQAITWFFHNVDHGIILEDDCVPHPDFLEFARILLEKYRDDDRIWCISGSNFQEGKWRGDGSYYFSRYNHCWGWASWRRCWQHYDPDLLQWPRLRDSNLLQAIFEDTVEREYWAKIWNRTHLKSTPVTWWDYQWAFTCLSQGGLTALPNRNLVSNIGFGVDATHTTSPSEPTRADEGLGELIHPSFVLRDAEADRYSFDYHFGGASLRNTPSMISRAKRRFQRYWKQLQRSAA